MDHTQDVDSTYVPRHTPVPRDLPFEPDPLPVVGESEACRILSVTPAAFRSLCETGRLVAARVEHGRSFFVRDEVVKLRRLLQRARRLADARRVSDALLADRAKVWADHLRHEARRVRENGARRDAYTFSSALEAAARVLEDAVRER